MIGVVLAGGASSRFGGQPKGLIEIGGRAMALNVADVLASLCKRVVIEARAGVGYEALGLPLIHAAVGHDGKGPLAGIAAGLSLAMEGERVAFAPCDMPLLDADVYRALLQVAENVPGAYAETADGFEPLVGILDAGMRPALTSALVRPDLPRTHAVLDAAGAVPVFFEDRRVFANVNAPADLDRLR